jgi:ADP-ribosylglycohydrolase
MVSKRSAYRGCLLGLSVGDAMGYTVDTKSWAEIREDYGPNGLLGYDLVNGYAEVSSHTQIAAFTCNGLLLGMTRGQVYGKMAPYVMYAGLAQQEWAIGQRRYDQPTRNHCWVFRIPELRRRHCTDTRMVETLNRGMNGVRGKLGTMEAPINHRDTPASISAAVAAGLFADPNRMSQMEIDRLGAECVALTHGDPLAFLPGAVVAHLICRCLRDHTTPLRALVEEALAALDDQFGREYRQTAQVITCVKNALKLVDDFSVFPVDAMEKLKCDTGADILAGAIYAALIYERDFDSAMIVAANHSGRSAAVGTVAGAILGARCGEEALPDFYMEGLEIATTLMELADDLIQGCPMTRGNKLFDGDWDRKYLHGEP